MKIKVQERSTVVDITDLDLQSLAVIINALRCSGCPGSIDWKICDQLEDLAKDSVSEESYEQDRARQLDEWFRE